MVVSTMKVRDELGLSWRKQLSRQVTPSGSGSPCPWAPKEPGGKGQGPAKPRSGRPWEYDRKGRGNVCVGGGRNGKSNKGNVCSPTT